MLRNREGLKLERRKEKVVGNISRDAGRKKQCWKKRGMDEREEGA